MTFEWTNMLRIHGCVFHAALREVKRDHEPRETDPRTEGNASRRQVATR